MVSVSGWSVVQVFTQVSRSQVSPRPTLVVCDFFACSYGKWSIQTPISMFDDCFYSHPIKKSRIDTPSLSLLNHRNDHFKPPKEWLMIDFPIDIPLLISHSYPSSPCHPHGASSDADPPPPAHRRAARGARRQDVAGAAAARNGLRPPTVATSRNGWWISVQVRWPWNKKTIENMCIVLQRKEEKLKKWWYLYDEFTISYDICHER